MAAIPECAVECVSYDKKKVVIPVISYFGKAKRIKVLGAILANEHWFRSVRSDVTIGKLR